MYYEDVLEQGERRTRAAERLRKAGLTLTEIGQRMGGITRQRVEHILHRENQRARAAAFYALKHGRLEKPTHCERCKEEITHLEAHHDDYAKQLDVTWLCRACHNIVHPHGRGNGKEA